MQSKHFILLNDVCMKVHSSLSAFVLDNKAKTAKSYYIIYHIISF